MIEGEIYQDESTEHPLAVVFDWDGVFSIAKQYVNRDECLQKVLATASSNKDTSSLTLANGTKWRHAIQQVAKKQFPDDMCASYDYAMQLACQVLCSCLTELEKAYRQQCNVFTTWILSALDNLLHTGCQTYICSGTIHEEVTTEVMLGRVDSKIDGIWGYPVLKNDLLNKLAEELQCDSSCICLVDDSVSEILAAHEQGFSTILVEHPQVNQGVESWENYSFSTEDGRTDSFDCAIRAAVAANRMVQPKTWVREFLGDDGILLNRIDTRFNDSLIWCARCEATNELFYCKVLRLSRRDAEHLGMILSTLAHENLPVSTWITSKGRQCLSLSNEHCVVMERALPGTPLSDPYHNDMAVSQCACVLARLHQGFRNVGPAPDAFRPNFNEGLDSIDLVVNSLWHLLIYSYKYSSSSCPGPSVQFHTWIEQHGKDVYLRLVRVKDELIRQLDASRHQWIFGDFNYSNVLFSESVVTGVIDYEDIHYGPRELDVLSFCMYGVSELHLPCKLNVFVRAYCDQHPLGLNFDTLSVIARGIANIRLARKICRLASQVHLGGETLWVSGEKTINYLNNLCEQLSDFEYRSR
ncbi:MAG: phosphotransferase [Deltaproteobacteria bacterium]|nr:phosphotransferase [Deltaproteobacteria bacterium]